MIKYVLLPLAVILLITFARLSFFTVDAAEYVYVTVLGQHQRTYDGADPVDGAGLKFGWPWPIQQTQRLDRRLQQFDLREQEQVTHDPEGNTIDKMLLVEAYVCWKIADEKSVDLFMQRIGTAERARAILEPWINSQLGTAIGKKRMEDLVNDAPADPITERTKVDDAVESLRKQLLDDLRGPALEKYGIELIDIRLRRFNHPGNVRDSIFMRIRSERNKKITDHLSDGDFKASKITSEADEQVRTMLARANTEAQRIKTEADTEATKIRSQAYAQDREFYEFLKKLETMQNILGESRSVLLLSTHRPLFDSLFQPPRATKKD